MASKRFTTTIVRDGAMCAIPLTLIPKRSSAGSAHR